MNIDPLYELYVKNILKNISKPTYYKFIHLPFFNEMAPEIRVYWNLQNNLRKYIEIHENE